MGHVFHMISYVDCDVDCDMDSYMPGGGGMLTTDIEASRWSNTYINIIFTITIIIVVIIIIIIMSLFHTYTAVYHVGKFLSWFHCSTVRCTKARRASTSQRRRRPGASSRSCRGLVKRSKRHKNIMLLFSKENHGNTMRKWWFNGDLIEFYGD